MGQNKIQQLWQRTLSPFTQIHTNTEYTYIRVFHYEGRYDRKYKMQHKIQEQNANYRLLDREGEK